MQLYGALQIDSGIIISVAHGSTFFSGEYLLLDCFFMVLSPFAPASHSTVTFSGHPAGVIAKDRLALLGSFEQVRLPARAAVRKLFPGGIAAVTLQEGMDQVSWHYYPQQSRRGPIASRRAFPARLLDPKNLDEVGYWADRIREWRDAFAPGKPIWLGETGNAQFGGEPGLSDAYLGGLWWLDQLGLLAQKGEDVVVRQTLSGMNYGLIEDETLSPRADYWNSLVWKKLMGQKVYRTSSLNESPRLRVYAHSSIRENCHEPVFLVINLDPDKKADVSFPDMFGRSFTTYVFTTRDIFSNHLLLNGEELRLENGRLPAIQGQRRDKSTAASVTLLPLSYAFVDFCE